MTPESLSRRGGFRNLTALRSSYESSTYEDSSDASILSNDSDFYGSGGYDFSYGTLRAPSPKTEENEKAEDSPAQRSLHRTVSMRRFGNKSLASLVTERTATNTTSTTSPKNTNTTDAAQAASPPWWSGLPRGANAEQDAAVKRLSALLAELDKEAKAVTAAAENSPSCDRSVSSRRSTRPRFVRILSSSSSGSTTGGDAFPRKPCTSRAPSAVQQGYSTDQRSITSAVQYPSSNGIWRTSRGGPPAASAAPSPPPGPGRRTSPLLNVEHRVRHTSTTSSARCQGTANSIVVVSSADFEAAKANLMQPLDTVMVSAVTLARNSRGCYTVDSPVETTSLTPPSATSRSSQDAMLRRQLRAKSDRQEREDRMLPDVPQLLNLEKNTSGILKPEYFSRMRNLYH